MRSAGMSYCLLALTLLGGWRAEAGPRDLSRLNLPPGFEIAVYAEVPEARQMALSPAGILYVGSRNRGEVRAVIDRDGDGTAEKVVVIAQSLAMPTGLAWHEGSLYVAAVSQILRYDQIDTRLLAPPAPVVVSANFPSDRAHGWKYLAFGPDGWLYVPVGAPCNICLSEPPYASIQRLRPDGSAQETYASGIRNSVGMAFHPVTGELWFTDNGRDWLGDDQPSCELNRATAAGQHFGYPFVHGQAIADPDFGKRKPPQAVTPPVLELGAHVAPLGLTFYQGTQFPPDYHHALLIAEHGSWNRSRKSGYRVTRVVLDKAGKLRSRSPFITGWLAGENAWGRPVDLLETPTGEVLISDDLAGLVYRVRYAGPAGAAPR